jgi:hypothetical protein
MASDESEPSWLRTLKLRLGKLEAKHWARSIVMDELFLAVARQSPDAARFLRTIFDGVMARMDIMDGAAGYEGRTAAAREELERIFRSLDERL